MRTHPWLVSYPVVALVLAACGGGNKSIAPIEEGDEDIGSIETGANRPEGLEPGGDYLHETSWNFIEAHCTEGPLDLGELGFSEELRIRKTESGLVLVRDRTLAAKGCVNTLMQHATPPPSEDSFEWRMVEQVKVVTPTTEECRTEGDPPRPGEVRMNGPNLEVLVQRSHWCDGFEVRFVYEPLVDPLMEGPQVVRHYVGHFNRRDADAIMALFAPGAQLVEPFTEVEEDTLVYGKQGPDPAQDTPESLRQQIRAWYAMAFGSVEWLALDLQAIEALEGPSEFRADWRYMDSRLEQPVEGQTDFLLAAGQIVRAEYRPFENPPQAIAAEDGAEGEGGGDEGEGEEPAADGDSAGGEETASGEGEG